VVDDRQVRSEREVLVDAVDAQPLSVSHRSELDDVSVDGDLARVGLMDADEAVEEGALARTVVAYESHDFAGLAGDACVDKRLHVSESLGQVRSRDSRRPVSRVLREGWVSHDR